MAAEEPSRTNLRNTALSMMPKMGFDQGAPLWIPSSSLSACLKVHPEFDRDHYTLLVDMAKGFNSPESWAMRQIHEVHGFPSALKGLLMALLTNGKAQVTTKRFGLSQQINRVTSLPNAHAASPLR
jgi:hypothetical protein